MNEYTKKLSIGEKCCLWGIVLTLIAVLLTASFPLPATVRAEDAASAKEEIAILSEELAAASEEEETTVESLILSEESIELIAKFLADLLRFDIHNTDPLVVSLANYFAGYAGQIVFFGNWESGRSGSFGKLMGLHDYVKNTSNLKWLEETLKHEHGHYEQYKQIGLLKYIFAIAIPSILHEPDNYYSQPWEVTADMLGGVTTHRHSEGSEEAGWAYLEQVKKSSLFTLVAKLFK